MSTLSSHVLDVALGQPARGVALRLEVLDAAGAWRIIGAGVTDDDGRARELLAGAPLEARPYRLTFETGAYFQATGRPSFYPRVEVTFTVTAAGEHHHIPLLLAPFGYSTYRGS
jgi:5-hydroxyisourate hydrolase